MNQYHDKPLEYDYGYDFDYLAWTSETRLTLCNVPWNNDYRDIHNLNNTQLNTYINSRPRLDIGNVSYARLDAPVSVDVPFNKASKYNYIRASNPVPAGIDDVQQDFYYFITGVQYIAGDTTRLTLQLDLWSTYGPTVTFGNSYIERGHIGIANENNFDNYGRDYLTKPEGIDVGGEYQTKRFRTQSVMSIPNSSYDILVCSAVDLEAEAGSIEDGPIKVMASGGLFSGLPAGSSYYIFKSIGSLTAFLGNVKAKPWVTEGITSITVIPPISRYIPGFDYGTGNFVKAPADTTPARQVVLESDWRGETFTNFMIPARYRHLNKLKCFPYMLIEMTTWGATPVVLKPEMWNNPDAALIERAALVPPNQRVGFSPFHYNSTVGGSDGSIYADDGGEFLDIATYIANFPTMAILNNAAIGYLSSNFNSLNFQHGSADYSLQKAMMGAQTSYDQATAGMDAATRASGIGINADAAQTALGNQTQTTQALMSAASSVGTGMLGGAPGLIGGMGAAASNLMGTAVQLGHNNDAHSLRAGTANAMNANAMGNAAFNRDTNNSLASFAANGDYQNTIGAIAAKSQDAKMIQPTTSGQVGGESMNLIHDKVEVSLRWKTIDKSAQTTIGEYWLRYGYAVEQFSKIVKLMVMDKFTYWKLKETYITAAPMPEHHKQAIRGMFEKGVTVWANPDEIGMIDLADNRAVPGVTL